MPNTPYITRYGAYSGSNDLSSRIFVAVHKAASDIIGEDAGTANHAARLAWAQEAIGGGRASLQLMTERMMVDVLTNGTIAADPYGQSSQDPDGDVQFVVNSLLGVAGNVTKYTSA